MNFPFQFQTPNQNLNLIMSIFSTLRKSISPFTQHFSIQRLQILHPSSPSTLISRNTVLATIVAGTSLGFLLYTTDFDSTPFQSSISSFVDHWSTPTSEDQNQHRYSPSSFFSKFSLPETSSTFLFGGKFLSRNLFNQILIIIIILLIFFILFIS
jgi:hypothetical protein